MKTAIDYYSLHTAVKQSQLRIKEVLINLHSRYIIRTGVLEIAEKASLSRCLFCL